MKLTHGRLAHVSVPHAPSKVVEHALAQGSIGDFQLIDPNSARAADMIATPPGMIGTRSARSPGRSSLSASPALMSSPRSFSSPAAEIPCSHSSHFPQDRRERLGGSRGRYGVLPADAAVRVDDVLKLAGGRKLGAP